MLHTGYRLDYQKSEVVSVGSKYQSDGADKTLATAFVRMAYDDSNILSAMMKPEQAGLGM